MRQITNKLAKEANIEYTESLEKLIDLVVAECIDAVEKSNTHHAYTSFSLDIAKTSKDKAIKAIKNKFND